MTQSVNNARPDVPAALLCSPKLTFEREAMKDSGWRDDAQFYVVFTGEQSSHIPGENATARLPQGGTGLVAAYLDAKSSSAMSPSQHVYVVAWTMAQGVRIVACYRNGECEVSARYHTHAGQNCWAPLILPFVSAYLESWARAIAGPDDDPFEDTADKLQRLADAVRCKPHGRTCINGDEKIGCPECVAEDEANDRDKQHESLLQQLNRKAAERDAMLNPTLDAVIARLEREPAERAEHYDPS